MPAWLLEGLFISCEVLVSKVDCTWPPSMVTLTRRVKNVAHTTATAAVPAKSFLLENTQHCTTSVSIVWYSKHI